MNKKKKYNLICEQCKISLSKIGKITNEGKKYICKKCLRKY